MPEENDEITELRAELAATRARMNDLRIATLETISSDHEKRIRMVEEVATKFNFLMALSIGGGTLSAIVLVRAVLGL